MDQSAKRRQIPPAPHNPPLPAVQWPSPFFLGKHPPRLAELGPTRAREVSAAMKQGLASGKLKGRSGSVEEQVRVWAFPFPAMPAPRSTRGSWWARGNGYMQWRDMVRLALGAVTPYEKPVSIAIVLNTWNNRADLDNYTKAILDAIVGIVIPDDSCKHVRSVSIQLAEFNGTRASGFTVAVTPLASGNP